MDGDAIKKFVKHSQEEDTWTKYPGPQVSSEL